MIVKEKEMEKKKYITKKKSWKIDSNSLDESDSESYNSYSEDNLKFISSDESSDDKKEKEKEKEKKKLKYNRIKEEKKSSDKNNSRK